MDAADLLNEALKLPVEARAALADSLFESLEVDINEDIEQAWKQEIQQRLREIDDKGLELISWPDALRLLQSRLQR